jgi:RNA polymerase sporulation-specific sigma factor
LKEFLNPLTTEEEQLLLSEMASGNLEAKHKLIEHNMRLVAHVAKKYYSPIEDPEDLLSIGTIGLLKAVETYDAGKGYKLATYAARCIDNELLMYFRGKRKTARDVSLYEPIGQDKEGNQIQLFDILEEEPVDVVKQLEEQEHLLRLRELLPTLLDEREQEIIYKRYGIGGTEGITQREIAKELGISRSYVSRIEKKVLHKLKKAFTQN